MKKVMFIASTGGHLAELLQLKSIFDNFDYQIVTEKTKTTIGMKKEYKEKINYVIYGNKHRLLHYLLISPINIIKSTYFFFKQNPDVIVSTGSHTCVYTCYLAKLFRKKIIYIETFANSSTKTLTGKFIYPIADKFIVQWESMLELYPKAIYGGWIY